jgi:hypothetical protein
MRVPRWAIERIEREGLGGEVVKVPVRGGTSPGGRNYLPLSEPIATREFPDDTPEIQAWAAVCVEHLGSPDEGVRRSAISALRFIGPAARPALEAAAAEGEGVRAENASRVIRHLDNLEARIEERMAQKQAELDARSPAAQMAKWYGVTEEQFPEFKAAVEEYYGGQADIASAVRKGEIESADAGRQIAELRTQFERKLEAVLDETQMERYRSTVTPIEP